MKLLFILLSVALILISGCSQSQPQIEAAMELDHIQAQYEKFTPVNISVDYGYLAPGDQQTLHKLVEASRLMNEIFLRQVYSDNPRLAQQLAGLDGERSVLRDYFDFNFGPFDRLGEDRPFIADVPQKPAGANYYPADMTREEFTNWLEAHPEDDSLFTGNFTIIRRDQNGLIAIPYSEAYREFLKPAAELLREAATLTTNASLATFLNRRADAFLSNNYYQSDMDWMDLADHDIEVVIGPYEVYEDELFNYKAAFESYITLVDREDSKKLKVLERYLMELEKRLPIPEAHKNYNRGGESPIKVVNEVFTGGEAISQIHTIAFNLPNDERVRELKGSKKVMLKNIIQAKYERISRPIMERVLAKEDLARVSFDAFFYHVLMHEMVHGIGPGKIVKDGQETTVSKELKETYSTLEEAKADIVGLFHFPYMVQMGVFDASLADQIYASFLGGIFRSVRFGIDEAHGGGNAIILNYLMEKGGVKFDDGAGRFSVDYQKIGGAVRDLSREILMIQAEGNYDAAIAFLEEYRIESPQLRSALDRLADLPVDIRVSYDLK